MKLSFSYIANAAGCVEGDWYDEPDEYYYFTIKKNSKQVKLADRETSWKDFSVELTQGDVLTISYDGYTSYYYAALKNFAAVPFYTLTLKTPDGATVVLKDRSGAEITGKTAHTPLPPVPMPIPSASSATRPRRGTSPLAPM